MKRLFTRSLSVIAAVCISTAVFGQCGTGDNVAPTITCPSGPIFTGDTIKVNTSTADCTYKNISASWNATASDNCPNFTLRYALTGAGSSSPAYNTGSTLVNVLFNKGLTIVTWTVTDEGGNKATCSYKVLVTDATKPIMVCPANDTMYVDSLPYGNCMHTITDVDQLFLYPDATDNCTSSSDILYQLTYSSIGGIVGDNPNLIDVKMSLGNNEFLWRVMDGSGNVSTNSCFYKITVVDSTPPKVTCPDTVTVNTDSNGPGDCTATVSSLGSPIAFDNCAVSLPFTNNAPLTYPIGNTTVTWTVADVNGNTSTCPQIVKVIDNENPIALCKNATVYLAADGTATITPVLLNNGSSDNCGIPTLSLSKSIVTCSDALVNPIDSIIITLTAKDSSGNQATCNSYVTVIDTVKPIVTCPANISVSNSLNVCGANVTVPLLVSADACGIDTIFNSFNANGANASGLYPLDTTVVVFTVIDNKNNQSTCSMKVIVKDTEAPDIICPNDTTVYTDPGKCFATLTVPDLIFNDECGIDSVVNDFNAGGANASGVYPKGITTVEFTVTDNNGNTSTCSVSVTVVDTELPVAVCKDTTLALDATGSASLVPADVDDGSTDNCAIKALSLDISSFNCSNTLAPVNITLTVTDSSNNINTCISHVTVIDTLLPSITCPSDIAVSSDPGLCSANITVPLLTFGDECDIDTVYNSFNINGADASGTYPVDTTAVEFTVIDVNGNISTCTTTIIVTDNELPIIVCPSDTSVSNDPGMCDALMNLPVLIFNDACGIDTVYNSFNVNGADGSGTYPVGATAVDFTVIDVNGNTSTCTTNIVVIDDELPTIVCPPDTSVSTDAGFCSAYVAIPLLTFGDECGIDTVYNSFNLNGANASDTFPLNTTSVEFTVIDVNGNTATCSTNVIVIDNEVPTIICPSDTSVSNDPGMCDALINLPVLVFNDACGIDTLYNSFNANGADASGTYPLGVTSVGFTVIDVNGNTATCSTGVTVLDSEFPVITCSQTDTITVSPDPTGCTYTQLDSSWDIADTSDNCDSNLDVVCILTNVVGDTIQSGLTSLQGVMFMGLTTVIWSATDNYGNSSTCSFVVNVPDNIPPQITNCTPDQSVTSEPGVCYHTHADSTWDALATDNCVSSLISYTYTLTGATDTLTSSLAGIQFELGNTNILCTAYDAAGNTDTCSFSVLVSDVEAPVVSCSLSDTTVVYADMDSCNYLNVGLTWDTPSTDNCTIDTIYYSLSGVTSGSGVSLDSVSFNLGTTTVTWTAIDGSGNADSCSYQIIVLDNQLPVLTCMVNDTVFADIDSCNYLHIGTDWDTPSTDNCTIDTIYYSLSGVTSGSGVSLDSVSFNLGTTTVTWTAIDVSGNVDSCSYQITVLDNQLPVLTCMVNDTVFADIDSCNYLHIGTDWDTPVVDNCSIDTLHYSLSGATNGSGVSLNNVMFNLGTTTVKWIAMDGSGNMDSCNYQITVLDNQLPVLTCLANDTVVADVDSCNFLHIGTDWDIPITDNCSIDTFYYSLSGATNGTGVSLDGISFNLGTTTVTWTAVDGSGNVDSCSYIIFVKDNQLPLITCVASDTVTSDAGACTYAHTGASWDAIAIDNCSIESISYVLSGATTGNGLTTLSGVDFNSGTTAVEWMVTDVSGNTATCQFDIVVRDLQAPIIAAIIPDTIVECSPIPPVAFDNCGPVSGVADFTNYAGDTIVVVTWTFTDAAGNTATALQTITFKDVTPPATPIMPDAVAQCDTTISAPTALDACMGTITGTTNDPLSYSTQGTHVITWSFDDGNGNTSQATQNVIIHDITVPTIIAPATVNVYPNNAGCTATGIDLGTPVTNDNCQVVSVVNNAPLVYSLVSTTVIWTVTDIAGNTATATQTVKILPLSSTVDTIACDVYFSPQGISLPASGTYISVIPGSFGCDSTITIHLTLNHSTTSSITLSSCDSYTAPDGQIYTNSGVYTAIIPNTQGCDSTITINLTIDSIETKTIQLNGLVFTADQSNVLYQWVNCDNNYSLVAGATQQTFEPLMSGDYAVILSNNTCIDTSECISVDINFVVPQVVTPNADGKNDVFEIQGIYDHPNNTLEIYNRWGNLVYRTEGYQNTWGGECTKGVSIGGEILPAGTYFYILDLGDGNGAKPSKGYIFLTK